MYIETIDEQINTYAGISAFFNMITRLCTGKKKKKRVK